MATKSKAQAVAVPQPDNDEVKIIPTDTARRIRFVLDDVMNELRALHEVSLGADEFASSDTFPLLTGAVCQHAHALLDRCSVELGAPPTGTSDPDVRFSGCARSETGAANG